MEFTVQQARGPSALYPAATQGWGPLLPPSISDAHGGLGMGHPTVLPSTLRQDLIGAYEVVP